MNTILLFSIIFILMVVAPIVLVFALKNHQRALKITTIVFACGYFVCMFIGVTCELDTTLSKTIVYFDYNHPWLSMDFLPYDFDLDNILINLFMFFPLGFIVYVFEERKPFVKTIALALLISLLVELCQFILPIRRFTELTDLLFNTVSGLISAAVCEFLLKRGAFKPNKNTRK